MRVRSWLAGLPPLVGDLLLALGITGVTLLLGHEYHGGEWQRLDAAGYVWILFGNLPVIWRRRAPVLVLACCAAAWTVFISWGYWPAMKGLGSYVALYTVAALRPPRVAWGGAVVIGGMWVYSELLGGHGLIGMRERVRLYDGTLASGPRPEGGFGVTLTLPTDGTG